MPHIIVKLWPGKSQQQKARLAQQIGQAKNLATACKAAVHEQQKSSSSPEPVAVLERPPLDISGHLERPLFWGARRIEKLHAIVTELTNNGAKATALTTDVTDPRASAEAL